MGVKALFKKPFTLLFILVIFALQCQITFSFKQTPIRISLSDLMLPFLCIGFMVCFKRETLFSVIKKNSVLCGFLFLLSVWFIFAGWNGYHLTHSISGWGLINKGLGWFILLGYFWIGSIFAEKGQSFDPFVRIFLIQNWLISLITLFCYLIWSRHPQSDFLGIQGGRLSGFCDSANAFGLMVAFSILIQLAYLQHQKFFSKPLEIAGLLLSIIVLFFSGSRGALLGLIIGMVFLWYKKGITVSKSRVIGIGCLIIIAAYCNTLITKNQAHFFNFWAHLSFYDHGTQERLETLYRAFHAWLTHPWEGIGLGSFLKQEIQSNRLIPSTIHATPMWVLTELGLIGLGLLLMFIGIVYKKFQDCMNDEDTKRRALTGMTLLFAFGVASFTNEILYQRYLWFFLGVLIASLPASLLVFKKPVLDINSTSAHESILR